MQHSSQRGFISSRPYQQLVFRGRSARMADWIARPVDTVASFSLSFPGRISDKARRDRGSMISYKPKSLNGVKSIVEDDVAVGSAKAE